MSPFSSFEHTTAFTPNEWSSSFLHCFDDHGSFVIHAFRHGVTSELLQAGTPIHLVTRMMRHADSKVTLDHYAHVIGDAERAALEKLSQRIGSQLEPDPQFGAKFSS